MMVFDLRIGGSPVDLYQDESVNLTRRVKDFLRVGKVQTDFTQEFTLPSTEINDAIFSNFMEEDIQLGAWNPYLKLEARIYVHTIPIFTGCVEMTGVRYKGGIPEHYKIVFYGQVKNAYADWGEKTLIDIDWSSYDHSVSYANVTGSWAGSLLSGDVRYPIVDWHKGFVYSQFNVINNIAHSNSGIDINDLRPWIRLKAMVTACFADIGFTLGGSLLSDTIWDKIYVAPMGQAGALQNPTNEDAKFEVNAGAGPISLATSAGYLGFQAINMTTAVSDPLGLFSLANDEYTCKFNGKHTFEYSLDITTITGTLVNVAVMRNGYPVFFTSYGIGASGTTETKSVEIDCEKGDKISLKYKMTSSSSCTLADATFKATQVPFGIDGTTISLAWAMPDLKVSEFINSFLEICNAVILPNGDDQFDLYNLDSWYDAGSVVDWTEYLDTDTIDHEKMRIPRSIVMRHQEGKDIGNQQFLSLNNRRFGEARFTPEVDFADEALTIESVFTIPVPSVMREINDQGDVIGYTENRMIVMLDKDAKPVQANLLVAFWGGNPSTGDTWYLDGNSQSTFPTMSPFENIPSTTASESLTFSLEADFSGDMATETLNVKYWFTFFSRLYSTYSRRVVVTGHIPVGEWLSLEMNQTIALSGRYYKIEEINYDIRTEKAVVKLFTYRDVNVTSFGSSGDLPSWTGGATKAFEGDSLFRDDIVARRLVNGRDFSGTTYTNPSQTDAYDQLNLQILRNQMFKANQRATLIQAYLTATFSPAVTGAAQAVQFTTSLTNGDASRFSLATYALSDQYGGQFRLRADFSFEQDTGSRDVSFYIAVDGVATLARADFYKGNHAGYLEAELDVGAGEKVELMVLDLNGESHTLDIYRATLTMELI